jgi:hypothetical protein
VHRAGRMKHEQTEHVEKKKCSKDYPSHIRLRFLILPVIYPHYQLGQHRRDQIASNNFCLRRVTTKTPAKINREAITVRELSDSPKIIGANANPISGCK